MTVTLVCGSVAYALALALTATFTRSAA
jgi:hypothetical protein